MFVGVSGEKCGSGDFLEDVDPSGDWMAVYGHRSSRLLETRKRSCCRPYRAALIENSSSSILWPTRCHIRSDRMSGRDEHRIGPKSTRTAHPACP